MPEPTQPRPVRAQGRPGRQPEVQRAPGRTRPLGPATALALLGASALLASCAASTHREGSHPAPPGVGSTRTAFLPEQDTPVRTLAIAYGASGPGAGPAAGPTPVTAGAAAPAPAPAAPPAPGQDARPRPRPAPGPAARAAAGRSAARPPQRHPGTVCDLAEQYGRWPAGSAQDATCRSVYG